MNIYRTALFSIAALLMGSTSASATSYRHIDRLSLRLEAQTHALAREVSRHYRHAAHFGHLIGDTRKMARLAHHIHDVAHRSGNPVHLQADLAAIDRLFHHLESVLAEIQHDASHGVGHVHGRARHVDSLMHAIEDTIHHLRSDIREMTRHLYHRKSHGCGHGYGDYRQQSVRRHASRRRVAVRTDHFGFRIGF